MKVTEREKAVIFSLAAGFVKTWTEAYILANQRTEEEMRRLKAVSSTAIRWRNRRDITEFYNYAVDTIKKRDEANQNKGKALAEGMNRNAGDSERPNTEKAKGFEKVVDYSDPANQMQKLNDLVNTADDSGEALDALKVIIATQKADKEAARERKQVVFYTPQHCHDCPMYGKALERVKKG